MQGDQATEEVSIEDLGSSNGTRLDGRTLAQGEAVILAEGRTAELGGAFIMLQFPKNEPLTEGFEQPSHPPGKPGPRRKAPWRVCGGWRTRSQRA